MDVSYLVSLLGDCFEQQSFRDKRNANFGRLVVRLWRPSSRCTQAKGKASAKKARKSEVGNGSYAAAENGAQQQHNSKKRGADEAEDVTPAEVPKRQKKASKSTAEADLQVC